MSKENDNNIFLINVYVLQILFLLSILNMGGRSRIRTPPRHTEDVQNRTSGYPRFTG